MHPWKKMYHKEEKECVSETDSGAGQRRLSSPGDSVVVRKLILSHFAGLIQYTHAYVTVVPSLKSEALSVGTTWLRLLFFTHSTQSVPSLSLYKGDGRDLLGQTCPLSINNGHSSFPAPLGLL